LKKSLTSLQNKCLEFSNRCVQRLKQVFYSVGASSEKFTPSAEDLPGAFEHIEGEIDDLDEVIAGHDDFCALVASRGTTVAFLKSDPISAYHQQTWITFPTLPKVLQIDL
jgi:hypothetical protein